MFRARSIQSSLSIKDKILSIDYILVISVISRKKKIKKKLDKLHKTINRENK